MAKQLVHTLDTMAVIEHTLNGDFSQIRHVCHKAAEEMVRACETFPRWPGRCAKVTQQDIEHLLDWARNQNESPYPTAYTILMAEVYEMLEAVLKGDLTAARTECVQAMAMMLRIYVHLPHYCAQDIKLGEVAS